MKPVTKMKAGSGHKLTTVGLPKWKGKSVSKLASFIDCLFIHNISNRVPELLFLHSMIVFWHLIDENQIECRPEKVLDPYWMNQWEFRLYTLFFTNESAWMGVTDVIQRIKELNAWIMDRSCAVCEKDLTDGDQKSIVCDSCLLWYHFLCVCLKELPKKKKWFCYLSHWKSTKYM